MDLHAIGGVYYMGRTPCKEIIENAIAKPIRRGNGWARRGAPMTGTVEYTLEQNGPKGRNSAK